MSADKQVNGVGSHGVRAQLAEMNVVSRVPGLRELRPRPTQWLINSVVPEQTIVLLSGTFASYKSWVALDMCYAVAAGGPFANLSVVQPRPVLYIDRENGRDRVASRLEAMNLVGDDALEHLKYWGNWTGLPFPGVDHPAMLEWAHEERGLLVFDSLTRFHRGNENSAQEMSVAMERFMALRDAGATLVILHHASKNPDVKYRGSEEIAAACDVCYHVSKHEHDRRLVKLDQYKNRIEQERTAWIRLGDSGRFSWDEGPPNGGKR